MFGLFADDILILLLHVFLQIVLFCLATIRILLWIASFYLIVVGTWRLANATIKRPMGGDWREYERREEQYNPLSDLTAAKDICSWLSRTIKSFRSPGSFTDVVILHKHFNWGLMWLLLGLTLQFFSQFCWLIRDKLESFSQSW